MLRATLEAEGAASVVAAEKPEHIHIQKDPWSDTIISNPVPKRI
jgi:hypothetical protein